MGAQGAVEIIFRGKDIDARTVEVGVCYNNNSNNNRLI